MSRKSKILLGLLLFNGLSATGGGLALMTDWIPEQASWVRDTDFPSNYFPGVILMAVVGGSSLIAAAALVKRSDGWQLASIVAGTIMVFWIIGEIASIRGFHFLQVIYLVTGALVVTWTPARQTEGGFIERPRNPAPPRPTTLREGRESDADDTRLTMSDGPTEGVSRRTRRLCAALPRWWWSLPFPRSSWTGSSTARQ